MVPLVDADGLVYLAGFATQKTYYDVQIFDDEGFGEAYTFDSHKEMKEALAEETRDYIVDKRTEAEPLSHALQIVKNKLQHIQDETGETPLVFLRADEQRNHRDMIAIQETYKGNRASEKPIHYQAIREYMFDHWGATAIYDREVDDEVSILSWQKYAPYCMICSPDKDLDQIPGHHWNYRDDVYYYVDEFEAKRWFWIQVLAGDAADNIPGCWKIGNGKAETLVDEWYEEAYDDHDIWQKIVETYEASKELPTCRYQHRAAEDVALETARLVYMQQYYHELWQPPGLPRGDTRVFMGESLDD